MKLYEIRNNIHPMLQSKLEVLVNNVKKKCGFRIEFSTGYRSHQEQDKLYAKGRTSPGKIVTNARGGYSQHNWGIAADFYIIRDCPDWKNKIYDNSDGAFNRVGELAQELGLGWGGTWKSFVDLPHLYLKEWGDTTKVLREQYGSFENFRYAWSGVIRPEPVPYTKIDFIREVQRCIGVTVDGIPGRKTLAATPTISRKENRCHAVVKVVQRWLNANGHYCGKEDGVFGVNTELGVKHYQEYIGFKNPDGIMDSGKRTWKAIMC